MALEKRLRFACLLTRQSSPFTKHKYGTYADLFESLFKRNGDSWTVYDAQNGILPDKVEDYDVLLITGSAADAHSDEPWIHCLNASIRQAYQNGTKLLGFCFGHQAVANALGGKSDRNPAGWELGNHDLDLTPEFFRQPFTAGIKRLKVLEIHQDHVHRLPDKAVVLASTSSTPVQVFVIEDRVFCVQGHPEFHNDIVIDLIQKRLEQGLIPTEIGQTSLATLSENQDTRSFVLMIDRFLGRA